MSSVTSDVYNQLSIIRQQNERLRKLLVEKGYLTNQMEPFINIEPTIEEAERLIREHDGRTLVGTGQSAADADRGY